MERSSEEPTSSSEGEEDEENVVLCDTDRISMSKSFPRPANSSPSSKASPSTGGAGEEDPESPGSSSSSGDGGNTRQSASEVSVSEGEGSSSEGVLVEHPHNTDQDSRSPHGDPDSGVLVNFDGSMHEGDHESEDGGREDTFVDAPEELSFSEGRSSGGLGDPMVLIDIAQSKEVERLTRKLEAAVAECSKYKEEREDYGREIKTLHRELRAMVNSKSGNDDDTLFTSPLDAIIKDCSKIASHLRSNLDEHLQLENHARDLSLIVDAKNMEIEELNMKVSETSVSHDVVSSYLNSIQETQIEYVKQVSDEFVQRLLSLTAFVALDNDEGVGKDIFHGFSLLEKRTSKLIESYSQLFSEVYQLGQCLSTVRADFTLSHWNEVKIVFDAARQELLEGRSKEAYFLQTEKELKLEKDRTAHDLEEAKAECSRTKVALEQAESKFMAAKEKLSIAVTKGKSLVQQRDGLRQLLNEKAGELQQKSDALEFTQTRVEELSKNEAMVASLQDLLSQQNNTLSEVDAVVSQIEYPMKGASLGVVDKVKWLADQKHIAEGALLEYNRLQGALSSINFPETISSSDFESQMNWLLSSFSESKENAAKLQEELSRFQGAITSCELQLLEAKKENDSLTTSIAKEREEIASLQVVNQDLTSKYEGIVEEISCVSSDKSRLMDALVDILGTREHQSSKAINMLIEDCLLKVNELKRIAHESSLYPELCQGMQRLLFLKEQELALSRMILEEETIEMSKKLKLAYKEISSLRDEKNDLQKDFERVEERCSLLREKLSMAVKKGKGLVQDREGLKISLDEKNNEIERLRHDLQVRESAASVLREQIETLTSDVRLKGQLENDVVSLKEERDQTKQLLQESKDSFSKVVAAIDGILLPDNMDSQAPEEKLRMISKYICEIEGIRREYLTLEANLKDLEKTLSEMEKQLSTVLEEKEEEKLAKVSAKQELEMVEKDINDLSDKLTQSYATIKNLEESLSHAENRISNLTHEKEGTENRSKQEILLLNSKLVACEGELAELVTLVRNLEIIMKEDGLAVTMVEGFRQKVECLQGLALLVEKVHNKFAASEVEGRPVSEKDPHLVKLLSFPSFADYFRDILSTTDTMRLNDDDEMPLSPARVVKASGILMNKQTERFRDFCGYVQEHISLLSQSLLMILDDIDEMMKQKDIMAANLKELEDMKRIEAQQLRDVSGNYAAVKTESADLSIALEKIILKLSGDEFLESKVPVDTKGLVQLLEMLMMNSLQDSEGLKSRVQELGAMLQESQALNEDLSYRIAGIMEQKDILAANLRELEDTKRVEVQQLREVSENYTAIEKESADLSLALEKIILKLGGNEFLESKRPVDTKGLVQLLERLMINSLQDSESLKSRAQELGAKLQESQALNEDLSSRIDGIMEQKDVLEANLKELEDTKMIEAQQLKEVSENYAAIERESADLSLALEKIILKLGGDEFLESKRLVDTKGLVQLLEGLMINSLQDSESLKSRVQELGAKWQESQALNEDLSSRIDGIMEQKDVLEAELKALEDTKMIEAQQLREVSENYAAIKAEWTDLSIALEKIILKLCGDEFLEGKRPVDTQGLVQLLERLMINSLQDSELLKSRAQELGTKLQESQALNEDLSSRINLLQESVQARSSLSDVGKDTTVAEGSSSVAIGPEIVEVDDGGHIGKKMVSAGPAARTTRKVSSEHLVLNVDPESERLLGSHEIDDKGHVFKSLNTSGLIPKEGKHIADRIDGVWVSAGRLLMGRPEARMGLIAYGLLLHIWVVLASIL